MYHLTWFETLVSLINVHILLVKLLQGKLRIKIIFILSITVITPCILLPLLFRDDTIGGQVVTIVCGTLTFIIPIFTIKNIKKNQIIYICLFYNGISSIVGTSCLWIVSSLKLNMPTILIIDALVYCFLLIICILMGNHLIFPKASQIMILSINIKIILLISTWFSSLLAYMLGILFNKLPYSPFLVATECLTALLIILVGIMCPLLITNNISSTYYKSTLSNVEKQMREQVKHYELITKANTEIRSFRHDYKNLKIGLTSLLTKNDSEGALVFLQECDKPFNAEYILFETGSPVADALLSEKQAEADKINTKIKFNGVIPNNRITPTDICIILGNSLDNALEACGIIQSDFTKTIDISAKYNNGFLFIIIKNPVHSDILISGNVIASTKSDKNSHGFGLYSIQNAVKNYSGSMNLACENNVFTMRLDFDLNCIESNAGDNLCLSGSIIEAE